MTKDEFTDLITALAPPVVTAILTTALGILGLVVADWRQRRTQDGRRKLALEDAGREVAFAADWWKARDLLAETPEAKGDTTSRALNWLEEAADLVARSRPPVVHEGPDITVRQLFLAYPMQSPGARFLRIAFYFFFSLVPIWVGQIVDSALNSQEKIQTVDVVVTLFLLGLAMAFRYLALRDEDSSRKGDDGSPPTLRRALLMYRFHTFAAKLVRFVFYVWAVAAVCLAVGAASDVVAAGWFVAVAGWTVFLRYWAVSLETRKARDLSTENGQFLGELGKQVGRHLADDQRVLDANTAAIGQVDTGFHGHRRASKQPTGG